MSSLRAELQAVVDADDAIEAAKALRAGGTIVHKSHWRGAYALRENADRALWGTHADDRAAVARRLLDALDWAYAEGHRTGHAEGYAAGYDEGLDDGMNK